MPEGTPAPDTTATDPAGQQGNDGGQGNTAPPTEPTGKAPQWDGDFDPERAARLVTNLRADLAKRDEELKSLRAAAGKKDDAEKSFAERLAALEKAKADAEHDAFVAKAAKKHNIPDDLLDLLTGTAEEIEAKAAALAARIAPTAATATDLPGRPKSALRPGHGGPDTEPFDPAAIAAKLRRR